MNFRLVLVVFVLLGSYASAALATFPIESGGKSGYLMAAERKLIIAYQDEVTRDSRVREVVLDAFRNASFDQTEELLSYLFINQRYLNLWFLADTKGLVSDKRQEYLVMRLIGQNKLKRLDCAERRSIYQDALMDGEYELSEGFLVTRPEAMTWASSDGCGDLWPLVEQIYPELESSEKKRIPIELLEATMDLRKGSPSEICGSASAAINKLSAMPPDEIEMAMDSHVYFQQAFLSAARSECAINPFDGTTQGNCTAVRNLLDRQQDYRDQLDDLANSSGHPADDRTLSPDPSPEDWLGELTQIVH